MKNKFILILSFLFVTAYNKDTLNLNNTIIKSEIIYTECNDKKASYIFSAIIQIKEIGYRDTFEFRYCPKIKYDTLIKILQINGNDTSESLEISGESGGSHHMKHWDALNPKTYERKFLNISYSGSDFLYDTLTYSFSVDCTWGTAGKKKMNNFKKEFIVLLDSMINISNDKITIISSFKKCKIN